MSRAPRSLLLALSLALFACTVDERPLTGPHFERISAGGGGGSDDEDNFAGEGSVHRWTFDSDRDGWVTEPGVEEQWEARDARNSAHSGALSVSDTLVGHSSDYWTGASTQCVSVNEGQDYRLDFDVFVPLQATTGGAGAAILYMNADACEGLMLDLKTLNVSAPGSWKHGRGTLAAPIGTKTALLRLLVSKISHDPTYQASFDNVEFGPD